MCQLLGMNSLKPAELSFSLAGFLRRGGVTDQHADGWGIAYFEQGDCRLLLDEEASCRSRLAQWVQRERLRSCNVVAHIRKATQGQVEAFNCHPFVRELWGRRWAFAHNGNLDLAGMRSHFFHPVGATDSEQAFCLLLDSLLERFGPRQPAAAALGDALREIAATLAERGSFNFLLSNGRTLFAHCSTELHHVQRAAPFGLARALDGGDVIDFAKLNDRDDRITVVATRPLSDERWTAMAAGQLIRIEGGCLMA